jgi:hypothetical protein
MQLSTVAETQRSDQRVWVVKKFKGPKKGRFPEIDYAVFRFFQERLRGFRYANKLRQNLTHHH